jgi:hypothetical protein
MKDILREPVELIDEDLDAVAGGGRGQNEVSFNHNHINGGGNVTASNNGGVQIDIDNG